MHETKIFGIGASALPQVSWQAQHLEKLLHKKHASLCFENIFIDGDVQNAFSNKSVSFAIQDSGDLSTAKLPKGIALGCVLKRNHIGEALLSLKGLTLSTLPKNARVAVRDSRTRGQLLYARKDLKVHQGLVDFDDPHYDAVVASYADVKRLKREDLISEMLGFDYLLPAPGQGALAVHCRDPNAHLLASLHDEKTHLAALAERSYFEGLGAQPGAPVAAFGQVSRKMLTLAAAVVAPDGSEKHLLQTTIDLPDDIEEARTTVATLGGKLARIALEDGAIALMERV